MENRREYEKRVGAIVEESWVTELEAAGSSEATASAGKVQPTTTNTSEAAAEPAASNTTPAATDQSAATIADNQDNQFLNDSAIQTASEPSA